MLLSKGSEVLGLVSSGAVQADGVHVACTQVQWDARAHRAGGWGLSSPASWAGGRGPRFSCGALSLRRTSVLAGRCRCFGQRRPVFRGTWDS